MERAEFLEAIRSRGCDLSDRKLTDWIERGLIAAPTKTSEGHGIDAYYDRRQVDLAVDLLGRHTPGQDVDGLYNEPVAMWLYWHNEGIVPLSQARRAWQSWAVTRSRGGRSGIRGLRAASELADQFAAAGLPRSDADQLMGLFDGANTTGQLDLSQVRDIIGDELLERPQIRGMVRVIERRMAAIHHRDELSDDDFSQARAEHLAALPAGYRQRETRDLVLNACWNLAAHLGDVYLNRQP